MFDLSDRKHARVRDGDDDTMQPVLEVDKEAQARAPEEELERQHLALMDVMQDEGDRQREERQQMQIDEDYYDHLQWRQEDAAELIARGQAPLVFNEARQTIDWIAGTEKRMRKDFKILPREEGDEKSAELKTKCVKFTDDVNMTQWARSKAFKQMSICGLSWLEEGANPAPDEEIIFSGHEDWRNVIRDSRARDLRQKDARFLFRKKRIDLDYAMALLPGKEEALRRAAYTADHDPEGGPQDVWYLGQKLTGASELSHDNTASAFGERSAYMQRGGHTDHGRRSSLDIIEAWYRIPAAVQVFAGGQLQGKSFNPADPQHIEYQRTGAKLYSAVKMKMHVMLATADDPLLGMVSPYRHNDFLLVPVWGYRRARDGQPYGVMRGMRDLSDDTNKRRSKALWQLSVNQIITEAGAVDDLEDLRAEAARPDGILVRKAGKELTFREHQSDIAGNLEMARENTSIMRNVGGVTNDNLGHETSATSGKAIMAKQDQGSLTTSELFDNLLMAIKIQGTLRLSHIEQFWTEQKALRIVGTHKPIEWAIVNQYDPQTGETINDITARQADFEVDTQDYRASMAQAAMEQMFTLLGQIATFAPQVVLSVLDLVVETSEIKDKEEWVARIRKLNGQRDPSKPPTPEEQAAEQTAAAKAAKLEAIQEALLQSQAMLVAARTDKTTAETSRIDTEKTLKKVEAMYSMLQAAQIVATVPGVVPVADEIGKSAGFKDEHPGAMPVPAMPAPAAPAMPAQPPVDQGFGPTDSPMPEPQPASPLEGVQGGIQTPTGADNVNPQEPLQ